MSCLDPRAIGELRELMGEDFDSLIDAFLADSTVQIDALETAARRADSDQVRRQAHGLKGACINLGANDLAEVCGRIEAAGSAGDCVSAQGMMTALHQTFAEVSIQLTELHAR